MAEIISAPRLTPARLEPIRLQVILCTALLIIVGALVLYPLFVLIFQSFNVAPFGKDPTYGLASWQYALTQPKILKALWNTFTLGGTQVVVSTTIAVFIAWVLTRTDLPARKWFELGFWISYFIPSLPVVLGWILLLDPQFGLVNKLIDHIAGTKLGLFNIYSWGGIVWSHVVTTAVSFKVILLMAAFRNMDSALEEASLTVGANNLKTALRVTLPVLLPAISVVILLALLHAFEAFEIELVLGVPQNIDVFSTMIYRLVRGDPPEFSPASAMGLLLMVLMVPSILLQQIWVKKKRFTTVSSRTQTRRLDLKRWKWVMFAAMLFFVSLLTVIPLTFLLVSTFMKLFGFFEIKDPWTTKHWITVLSDPIFLHSLLNTFLISMGAAAVVSLMGAVIAYVIVRTKFVGSFVLSLLAWVPALVPGMLMSLGVLTMFLTFSFFRAFYGTVAILIFAFALSGLAISVQIFKATYEQIGQDVEEASWVAGGAWRQTFFRVLIPLLAPTMVGVAVIIFVQTSRHISTAALLSTSSSAPLSMLQLQYMQDGTYEQAGVVGVIITVLVLTVTLVARRFGLSMGLGGNR
jgi:iron(III) transport system permease protein